jgi:hypothetical protein
MPIGRSSTTTFCLRDASASLCGGDSEREEAAVHRSHALAELDQVLSMLRVRTSPTLG